MLFITVPVYLVYIVLPVVLGLLAGVFLNPGRLSGLKPGIKKSPGLIPGLKPGIKKSPGLIPGYSRLKTAHFQVYVRYRGWEKKYMY